MEDEHPSLPIQDFAQEYGYPPSFVRLLLDCGCPTRDGLVDFPTVVMWFLENWAIVRERAGLPELPTMEGLPKDAAAHTKMGYTFLTLQDYIASRASTEETKAAAAGTSQFIREVIRERLDG